MPNNAYKILFVCGTGRCGTTQLADTLGAHESIMNMGETHLFYEYIKLIQIFRKRFIKGMVKAGYSEVKTLIDTRSIHTSMLNFGSNLLGNLFVLLQEEYPDKRIYLDKTPHNLAITDMLNQLYLNPYFIHVVRHPLDVFASTKNKKWGYTDVSDFVTWYSEFMDVSLKKWEKLPGDRKKVIVFEEHIEDVHIYQQLLHWLSLLGGIKKIYTKNVAHVNRYKMDLSNKEINAINLHCIKFYDKWRSLR